jgi:hypothetical protein
MISAILNASGTLSFISSSTCFTWDITSHYINPSKQWFQTIHICIPHDMWNLIRGYVRYILYITKHQSKQHKRLPLYLFFTTLPVHEVNKISFKIKKCYVLVSCHVYNDYTHISLLRGKN